MNHIDDKLSALLHQWRDIEPCANFEANVRRRIRLAQGERPERVNLSELLERLMWRPALAVTAAVVVVGSIIGSSAGVLTTRRTVSVGSNELRFLSGGTLAGGYVKLVSEGGR
jgi:anti-sigma-K factor RskA